MSDARRLLVFLSAINMLNYVDRYVLPAVLVQVEGAFGLDHGRSGSLPTVFMIVYMLASPIFGFLGDRYSRPRLVAFGIALWSLATAAAAFAAGYWSLLATRALVGVGEAAYVTLGPAMLSDLYAEKDRARAFTWFFLAIPVGSALGFGLGGFMASQWGWRSAFLVAGVPGLLFAWRMALLPDPTRGGMDTAPDPGIGIPFLARLGLILRNRIWVATTVCYAGYTFAMGALSFWSPSLLQFRFQVNAAQAGMVFGALAVVTGILGTFLGGHLTDRWQSRWPDAGIWISGLSLLAAAPVVYLALHATSLPVAIALYFSGMLLLFLNTSPVNAAIVSCLPASVRAGGVAINVLLIHLLGDVPSPWWAGLRADVAKRAGHSEGDALALAMGIVIPALLVGAAALWWARHREPLPNG